METPKEYYYTYYSYEKWGRGYIGSRGCKCLPEEDVKYFGSFSDKNFNPTYKIILKDDYTTREEAYADEIILHDYYDVANNPHFANRANATSTKFYVSRELASENGKKGTQIQKEMGTGVWAITPEQRTSMSKKGVQTQQELGLGIYGLSEDQRREIVKNAGKISIKRNRQNKTGIFGMTPEEKSQMCKKGGKIGGQKTYELGVGIHGLTKEQMSENSCKGGKKAKELGLGIHALNSAQKSEAGKKGGEKCKKLGIGFYKMTREQRIAQAKKNNSQKWMCLETGYITTSGPLTKYQRKRGIDTSKRKQIE